MIISPLPQGMIQQDGRVNLAALQILLNELRNAAVSLWASGTTAQRPRDPVLGQIYYDTTLAALVVCKTVRTGATAATWAPV